MSQSTTLTYDEMEKLNSWNMKSVIQCPSCKRILSIQRQVISISNLIELVIMSSKSPITPIYFGFQSPKNKYICLSCGKDSVHSKSRLMKSWMGEYQERCESDLLYD